MLPFRTEDRIFCPLCGGNRLLIHSKSIQRYPIYLSLHKILDGTSIIFLDTVSETEIHPIHHWK